MINVSKFAFCGIVACVSMLGGCVTDDAGDLATDGEALVVDGEGSEDVTVFTGEEMEAAEQSAGGDIGLLTVVSFHRSCNNARFDVRGDGAVVFAEASSCRRRNGTWTGYRSWRGVCFGNVANLDGNIRCNP